MRTGGGNSLVGATGTNVLVEQSQKEGVWVRRLYQLNGRSQNGRETLELKWAWSALSLGFDFKPGDTDKVRSGRGAYGSRDGCAADMKRKTPGSAGRYEKKTYFTCGGKQQGDRAVMNMGGKKKHRGGPSGGWAINLTQGRTKAR